MPRCILRCLRVITVFGLATTALSQANHRVIMGVSGSFYDPPTIAAQENDTVTFVFGNGIHGVTQSSFETPCVPLPGGFNSGLVSGLDLTQPVKVWDLHITNASEPIWFFCQATRPQSHCAAGMVGAINAPATMFPAFQAAAKNFTGTQDPAPSVVLSGIGAFATNSPSAPPGSVAPSPTSTDSSSSTSEAVSTVYATPTSVTRASKVNTAAIAGGTVSGVVVVAVIIALSFLLYRSHRQRKEEKRKHDEMIAASQPFAPQFVTHYTPISPPTSPPPVFSDLRPNDHSNIRSATTSSSGAGTGIPEGAASPVSPHMQLDVRELAREVVALINTAPSGSGSVPGFPLRTPSEVASSTALDPRNRSDSNISGSGRNDGRVRTHRY